MDRKQSGPTKFTAGLIGALTSLDIGELAKNDPALEGELESLRTFTMAGCTAEQAQLELPRRSGAAFLHTGTIGKDEDEARELHRPLARFLVERPEINRLVSVGERGTYTAPWVRENENPCEAHARILMELGVPRERFVLAPGAKNTPQEINAALKREDILAAKSVCVISVAPPQTRRIQLGWEHAMARDGKRLDLEFIRIGGWDATSPDGDKRVLEEAVRVMAYGLKGDIVLPSSTDGHMLLTGARFLRDNYPGVWGAVVEAQRKVLVVESTIGMNLIDAWRDRSAKTS